MAKNHEMFNLVELDQFLPGYERPTRIVDGRKEILMICEHCGQEVWRGHPLHNRRYCSDSCGASARSYRQRLGTLLVGSLQEEPLRSKTEMVVAADLRLQGWFVFFPMGPNAPCDLIITWYGLTARRVEVKTADVEQQGDPVAGSTEWHHEDHDVKAFVLPDGSVRYDPPLAQPQPV